MTQTIVNLTLSVITNKVKGVLENTLAQSHHSSIAPAVLEAKLVAYVLRRMPAVYATADELDGGAIDNPIGCFSPTQQQQMDQLIDEGLHHLMARRDSWETAAQQATSSFGPSPSDWFG